MVDANIDEVFIGIESPNEEALRETKKIQNLSDKHGTVMEKVRRIQDLGIEVWCGMIVGFDTDDHTVFEMQRQFLETARIPLAMVNVLTAIPRTPLFERLEREGRLDNSGELANFGTISTNVIPKRISRQALCDGYLQLLKDLYTPEAYFGRMDALYLDGSRLPPTARSKWLRRHPWHWFKSQAWTVLEVSYIVVTMMHGIPNKTLTKDYRKRLWTVVRRRPSLRLLRIYAVKCALHWHFDQLIAQMRSERAELPVEVDTDTRAEGRDHHGHAGGVAGGLVGEGWGRRPQTRITGRMDFPGLP